MAVDLTRATIDVNSDTERSSDGYDSAQGESWSDTSSDMTELHPDEFPDFFAERGGRLFHSHGRSPYPLPVDADEQHRFNRQHKLFKKLLGGHFVGPVPEVLEDLPGEQRRVVDLGTGTGKWVMRMARDFPRVKFDGLDIVPIATRYPRSNALFIMKDITARLDYRDGSIDLVHARDISMGIKDYPRLMDEVARVLRPGGLYIAGEWGRCPVMCNGSNIMTCAPGAFQLFDILNRFLERQGLFHAASGITGWLETTHSFTDIQQRQFMVPVGDWHSEQKEIGNYMRGLLELFTSSTRILLARAGFDVRFAERLINSFLHEMEVIPGMVFPYYTVHARKV